MHCSAQLPADFAGEQHPWKGTQHSTAHVKPAQRRKGPERVADLIILAAEVQYTLRRWHVPVVTAISTGACFLGLQRTWRRVGVGG